MLKQRRSVSMDHPKVAPLQLGEIARAENRLRRPKNQSQRRAQFVTDIGKEVALDPIQAPDLVEQSLQFRILPGDLRFSLLLLRNIAAFCKQKHDFAVLVPDW